MQPTDLTQRSHAHSTRGVRHEMLGAGAFENDPERDPKLSDHQSSADSLWMRIHGMVNTHADALAHVGFQGYGFNGRPYKEIVTMKDGALLQDITDALGVVTRGVLADIPRYRGIEYLQPGDSVTPEDLRATVPDLRPGDALVIRTGTTLVGGLPPEGRNFHGTWAGLHARSMDFIREHDVAVLATDGPGDTFPSTIPECESPIHVLSLTSLGLHVIHNMDLEELARFCHANGRHTFMFCVASLNLPHGTGSLVTPLAIL